MINYNNRGTEKLVRKLYEKYKEIITYSFFGVLTTIINTLAYLFLYDLCEFSNMLSNLFAWLLAVTFAFFTNKIWVFGSKDFSIYTLKSECIKFFGCRIGTGMLDMLIMSVGVDVMHGSSLMYKLLSNIVVIICNYLASKIFIFNK